MFRSILRSSLRPLALVAVALALAAAPAHALIPVPFFPPDGGVIGIPDPPDPPIDEKPIECPPCECPPGAVNGVPEPATMASAAVGALLAGAYAWRRRGRK